MLEESAKSRQKILWAKIPLFTNFYFKFCRILQNLICKNLVGSFQSSQKKILSVEWDRSIFGNNDNYFLSDSFSAIQVHDIWCLLGLRLYRSNLHIVYLVIFNIFHMQN